MTPEEEARYLAATEVELRDEFPNVPAVAVREAISAERQQFKGAVVRDFVPLLVRRTARERLRHRRLA